MDDQRPDVALRGVGVVIPTLNASRFLAQTLSSVGALVASGAEAIVVDGGSIDDTQAICQRHQIAVIHEGIPGLYAAINRGFRHLSTPWLTWINADDIVFPSGIQAYRLDLEAADIHYGTVDFIDADGRFLHSWRSARPRQLKPLYRSGCSPLLQQGTVFRREVFDRLNGFNAEMKYVADADFWWRAVEAGFRFKRLKYPTVAGFRLHGGQLSQVHAVAMRREHQEMVVARQGRSRGCSSSLLALAYRLSNASRYLVRFLRRRDISGETRMPRSYDVA